MTKISLRHKITQDLGISESQLNRLLSRAPRTYKVYTIPKKTGGKRTIAQPAKETKYIQYWLIDNIFKKLPIHRCAKAYKPGASIRKNAFAHSKRKYLTKFDFKEFFTSIKESDLQKHFACYLDKIYSSDEINIITRISCIQYRPSSPLCLSIGAPSSPILSNTLLYEFDKKVSEWCRENKVIYTRYADDLTFSTNVRGMSNLIESNIRIIVKELDYPSLRFNRKKTVHLSMKHQRRITGLVITNDKKVSIGRDKKREISALIHRYSIDLLNEDQTLRLQGLLGFAKDAENQFIFSMKSKYGSELVEEILKKRKPIKNLKK